MNKLDDLGNLGQILIHNSLYLGIAFLILLLLTQILMRGFLRLSNFFMRSKTLEISESAQQAWRRRTRRLTLAFTLIFTLGLIAGTLVATWRKVRIGEVLLGRVSQMQAADWVTLGTTVGQTLGVIVLAFVVARIFIAILHYIRERLQSTESLSGHRERITELLARLRLALSCSIVFATLIACAQLLGIPEAERRVLRSIAYIGIAIYVGRFAVGAAHLVIDVLFDLSDVFSRLENPLRYLGRFRHLSALTKRTADYFIYVGFSTWTLDHITPGTWASEAGRLAIRIIAIFYISRVLVEVCILFMNEFFLTRDQQTDAEFHQRQTLVPVAAGLLRYGIYFAAVAMILREAGIDPTPLLAGAGVAGVAIGLGAQAFVGDIVAGFFILLENLFLVGDFIEVAEVKGKVEEIGVRITKIRDENGVLHSIPNGEVRKVASESRGYVNVVIDLPVTYDEDLHKVFGVLKDKTAEVRAQESAIIGVTEFNLEELRESAVLLRTTTMVKPGAGQEMSAILRMAFWEALTDAGVAAPYTRRMMVSPDPGAGPLASRRQRGPADRDGALQTDIQKVKLHNLYRAFDIDGNGYIDLSDVDALARRIVENQGLTTSSALHADLQRKLHAYWTVMVSALDVDSDARVSKEEFLQFAIRVAKDMNGAAGRSIQGVSDMLFTVADRDGKGTLSATEFVRCMRSYGILDTVTMAAFELVDADKNGHITREEFLAFMREVFQSQSLSDASAMVFGPGCRGKV